MKHYGNSTVKIISWPYKEGFTCTETMYFKNLVDFYFRSKMTQETLMN